MAKVDLRTYIALEQAFVRRLQRSWRIQSAPTYAAIAKACNEHKWDEARRLVSDLDMAEVGTANREWITYMLLSCAVFGANIVARGKPSFVGVGSFDTFLKQTANNMLQSLEHGMTSQVQEQALQAIAEDEAKTKALKFDESKHPRDKDGQFSVVPTAPGTTPIPPGKIRGYHYTEAMDSVEKEGLSVAKAKGAGYGEPNTIWFSTQKPRDLKNYVEVFIDPDEIAGRGPLFRQEDKTSPEALAKIEEYNKGDHDFMTYVKEIPPERFVTTHRPWHDHYRYIAKDKQVIDQVLAGEFDWMLDQEEYGPAILAIKRNFAQKFDRNQPRDAKGRWSVTTTPEFKAWFGDWEDPTAHSTLFDKSKTPVSYGVEAYGTPVKSAEHPNRPAIQPVRPKVYYHGTLENVEAFEVGRPGMNSNVFGPYETTRHALFFAETPEHAQAFTSQGGKTAGANVLPVYLKMQAPLDFTKGVSDDTLDELAATGEISRGWLSQNAGKWESFDDEGGAMFVRALTKAGYDSVIFWDQNPANREDVKTVAIFTPEQVKSALGNRRFDPNDPRITKFDLNQPRDAKGRWSVTGTPEFKAWFGDSKIVDDHGQPLVLYHGTTKSFDEFQKPGSRTAWDTGFAGEGFYFGDSKTASGYAGEETGSTVLPVYLHMEKPLRVQEVDHRKGGDDAIIAVAKAVGITVPDGVDGLNHNRLMPGLSKAITAKLQETGHDGVIYTWAGLRYTEYMVIDQHQIKSAIANRQFDPKDPRITKFDEAQHPRDTEGQFIDAISIQMKAGLRETHNPRNTFFLLSDGTRLTAGGYNNHAKAALAAGTSLDRLLQAGVVRYVPHQGIEVSHTLTRIQAQTIVDDFIADRVDALSVDVRVKESSEIRNKVFDVRSMSPSSLMRFVELTLTAKKWDAEDARKFDESLHPRDKEGQFAVKPSLEERYPVEPYLRGFAVKLPGGGLIAVMPGKKNSWTVGGRPYTYATFEDAILDARLLATSKEPKLKPVFKSHTAEEAEQVIAQAKAEGQRVLFHSGDASVAAELSQGIEPQMGDWVREVLSGATDDDEAARQIEDDPKNAVAYYSETPEWVSMKASRMMEGKHVTEVTPQELEQHGHLSVVVVDPDNEDLLTSDENQNVYHVGSEKALRGEDIPFGVEPGDIYTHETLVPDVTLTGKELLRFLHRNYPEANLLQGTLSAFKGEPGIGGLTRKFDAAAHPRGDDGRFIEATQPRIFNRPDEVRPYDSMGGEKRWGWLDPKTGETTGRLLTGQPIPPEDMRATLYHVTTNAPAVESSGVLLGQLGDAGLGGGQAPGVSFTTSHEDATVIQRELVRAVQIAQGTARKETIAQWAREDEKSAKLPDGSLQGAVDFAMYNWNDQSLNSTFVWDKNLPEDKRGWVGPPPSPEEHERLYRSMVGDAQKAYLQLREREAEKAAGHPVTSLKNPILFGRQEQLAKLNPKDVQILEVPSAQIPEGALVTTGSDDFLHEVRAYSDVPLWKKLQSAKYDRAQPRDEDGKWTKDRNNREQTTRIIQDYVSGSTYVNDTLRSIAQRHRKDETWDQDEEIQGLLGDKVALLDAQMQKNVLPEDTTLFRSVPNYVLGELKVGDVYQDDGYVSTTRNAASLQHIRQDIGARNEGNHSTVIVQAPKGLGHIDVNQELGQHVYDYQEEVILPHGLQYQVVGLGQGHTLTVKVLP